MSKRISLAFLATLSPTILAVSIWDLPLGSVVFSFAAVVFPVALIAVSVPRLARPLVGLAFYYGACIAILFLYRGEVLEAPWILGLPMTAAVQVYGLWLLPLVFVSFLHGATFEQFGLEQKDLESLRRRFAAPDDESS